MTEAKAIAMMIGHLEGQFPKSCPKCNRRFENLRDFYTHTEPSGDPISYDLELGDVTPAHPVGAVAMSNCPCGTTLALTSDGMPLLRLWSLLRWAKNESEARGITIRELLKHLRREVRQKVRSEPEPERHNLHH